jgi:hypothetical protein
MFSEPAPPRSLGFRERHRIPISTINVSTPPARATPESACRPRCRAKRRQTPPRAQARRRKGAQCGSPRRRRPGCSTATCRRSESSSLGVSSPPEVVTGERRWTAIRCSSCEPTASNVPKRRRNRRGSARGVVAVNKRCRRGRLPFVEKAGRRWFRRDHLELVKHADLVKRPAGGV